MLEIDLEFQRGSFPLQLKASVGPGATGVFGPSGCGKSTLLALIAGLLRPARGSIVLQGNALVDTATGVFVPPWKRHIALVFQDGQLFPHLTVRDNLLYGFRRRAPGARQFELDGVLGLLEIGPLLERRPAQLSGGERQRVALGRALLCSPRMLLLDEPLASLDERLKQQILPYLARVKRETALPMLYVSHVRAEVDFLADRTLHMEDGRIVA
ncbi:MAG TPA: ATP-binding cassette domain-containing protein [Steroidobacteraceae bacterium]